MAADASIYQVQQVANERNIAFFILQFRVNMLPGGQFLRCNSQGYITLNFHYSQFIFIKHHSAYQTEILLQYMIGKTVTIYFCYYFLSNELLNIFD